MTFVAAVAAVLAVGLSRSVITSELAKFKIQSIDKIAAESVSGLALCSRLAFRFFPDDSAGRIEFLHACGRTALVVPADQEVFPATDAQRLASDVIWAAAKRLREARPADDQTKAATTWIACVFAVADSFAATIPGFDRDFWVSQVNFQPRQAKCGYCDGKHAESACPHRLPNYSRDPLTLGYDIERAAQSALTCGHSETGIAFLIALKSPDIGLTQLSYLTELESSRDGGRSRGRTVSELLEREYRRRELLGIGKSQVVDNSELVSNCLEELGQLGQFLLQGLGVASSAERAGISSRTASRELSACREKFISINGVRLC